MEDLIQPAVDFISILATSISLVVVMTWTTTYVVRVFLQWTGFIQDEL